MSDYFLAEKQESLIFLAVGLLATGFGVWLWMNGHRLKSMAYPLVAIALLPMVVGATVYRPAFTGGHTHVDQGVLLDGGHLAPGNNDALADTFFQLLDARIMKRRWVAAI